MGYTTEFDGGFELDRQLSPEDYNYLKAFSEMRHVQRNEYKLSKESDPIREAVGLPVGRHGEYFVRDEISQVINENEPPPSQPGLYCQWVPWQDGKTIVWDGNEKFNQYKKWLEYIIKHFIAPWGYTLNGDVQWQGEEIRDRGILSVRNNRIESKRV